MLTNENMKFLLGEIQSRQKRHFNDCAFTISSNGKNGTVIVVVAFVDGESRDFNFSPDKDTDNLVLLAEIDKFIEKNNNNTKKH